MTTHHHDIITVLEREQCWHRQQLKRIELAMQPAKSQESCSPPKGRVAWQIEITRIFETHDSLRPLEVVALLVESGIHEAAIPPRKMHVYSTLAKLARQGVLEKVEKGVYRKKPE